MLPVSTISFFDCHENDLPSAEAWITNRVAQIATATDGLRGDWCTRLTRVVSR